MSNTPNLDLERPDKGDADWHTSLNSNMTKLDTGYGNNVASIADLPEVYIETGTFNFTTGDVITLPKSVDAVSEYSVVVVPSTGAGVDIGFIYVSKAVDDFTVYCTGNNTTDTYSAIIYYIGDIASYGGSIYRKWYVSPDAAITDHGDDTETGSLAWVLDQVGATAATVELPGNKAYVISTTLVVAANIHLIFQNGAVLTDDGSNADLTINGTFDAGLYQIFDWGNGSGSILFGNGTVEGIRPEWYGGLGDDSTNCTAAFVQANVSAAYGVTAYEEKQNILLSAGVYRVTAGAGSYAVTVNCPIVGEGPDVSVIKNVGLGSALKIEGVTGEIYYSRWRDFSVIGNASSENGIVLNVTAALLKAVGYSAFTNVDSHEHGGHGLIHDGSWGTRYIDCKFYRNGGLGVYLPGTGAYSQHNNIIFLNCDSRWNGGTGNASADFAKGGVRISGASTGVYWIGGVVESNNAWGFIVGEDATYAASKVMIENVYGEGHPDATFTSATGGFFYLSAKYFDVSVTGCEIVYGATAGKTGYAFYIEDVPECSPGFREYNNSVTPDLRGGTVIRDHGITYAEKWNSSHEIISFTADRNFSGANHWVDDDMTGFDATTDLTITAAGSGQYCHLPAENINNGMGLVYGKRYGIKYDATASGVAHFASVTQVTKLPNIVTGTGQAYEFVWMETNANQSLYIFSGTGGCIVNLDNISIYEIDGGLSPQSYQNGLLSATTISLAADDDTAIYIVPTGRRCVLSHAILVVGTNAGTTTISIGAEGATYADFIPTSTLSNIDAQYDACVLTPISSATPLKIESYAAGAIIYAHVAANAGGASNRLFLYGTVY